MSLEKVAQHLAAQGRGTDSVLVHMSPKEVGALQHMAKQHGGSLSVNPQTGLPEAGFLDAILPMVAGAGLAMIPGVGPLMAAGIVGGGTALLTKDLNKGLMAGLGAFGGAGLAGGIMSAGAGAGLAEAGAAAGAETTAGANSLYSLKEVAAMEAAGMTPAQIAQSAADYAGGASGVGSANMPFTQATQGLVDKGMNPSAWDQMQRGFQATKFDSNFLKNNMMPIGAALAPALMGGNLFGGNPANQQKTENAGYVRPYTYSQTRNPNYTGAGTPYYTQTMTPGTPIASGDYGSQPMPLAAEGGIMDTQRMADGGIIAFKDRGKVPERDNNNAPTVRELLEILGSDRDKYERLARGEEYNRKDYSANEIQAAMLLHTANKTKDPGRYLESLNPFHDNQLNYALANTNYKGMVTRDQPNTTTMRRMDASTLPHELTHSLQLHDEDRGNKISRELYPYVSNLNSETQDKIFGKAINRFANPKEVYANLNAYALLQNAAGGDFVNSPEGRALLPDRKSQGQYYANTMPNVQSIYGYREDSKIPEDKFKRDSRDSYATQLAKYAKHKTKDYAEGGIMDTRRMADGGIADVPVDPAMATAKKPPVLADYLAATRNATAAAQNVAMPVMQSQFISPQQQYTAPVNQVPQAVTDYNNMLGQRAQQEYVVQPQLSAMIPQHLRPAPVAYKAPDLTPTAPVAPQKTELQKLQDQIDAMNSQQQPNNYTYDQGGGGGDGGAFAMGGGIGDNYDGSSRFNHGPEYPMQQPQNFAYGGGITNSRQAAVQSYAAAAQKSPTAMKELMAKAQGGDYDAMIALNSLQGTPNQNYAAGGGIYDLGGYSDGGRLLKGPGDGVSDDIPAQIGNRQPARLADGEFVVPARIVSELGNGSTDAGAKRLYAMMERVQSGRKKSIGKDKVAVDSKARKHLPV